MNRLKFLPTFVLALFLAPPWQAFAAAQADAGSGNAAIASALVQARRSAVGKSGGDIYDLYAGMVQLAVQQHWHPSMYSHSNLMDIVRVKLDANGKVLDARVERSSGQPSYDALAINAVKRAEMPKPPTPAQQNLLLLFRPAKAALSK